MLNILFELIPVLLKIFFCVLKIEEIIIVILIEIFGVVVIFCVIFIREI